MFYVKYFNNAVFAHLDGGNIYEFVQELGKADRTRYSMIFIRQVLSACEYLSTQRIAHLDIKPENILIESKSFSPCSVCNGMS